MTTVVDDDDIVSAEAEASALSDDDELLAVSRNDPRWRRCFRELVHAAKANVVLRAIEQERIWRAGQRLERYHIDGLGEQKACIHPSYMNELCTRYGPSWHRDPDALRDTLKRYPQMAVRSMPRHLTLRVDGLKQLETRLPMPPLPEERAAMSDPAGGNGPRQNPAATPDKTEDNGPVMETVSAGPLIIAPAVDA